MWCKRKSRSQPDFFVHAGPRIMCDSNRDSLSGLLDKGALQKFPDSMRVIRAQPVEFPSSGLINHLHGVVKMTVIQFLTYAAVLVFLIVVLAKVIKYKSTPIHLRWELYPVAHEKGRASYGGSVFEEMEWWDKPRHKDRINELKEMFQEIVLLKGVYHHNRKVWYSSFPFHLGLYLVAYIGQRAGEQFHLGGDGISFIVRIVSVPGLGVHCFEGGRV